MGATTDAYAELSAALDAFMQKHPDQDRTAIAPRFEWGFHLLQAGAAGPAEVDGSRHVRVEGSMGRACMGVHDRYDVRFTLVGPTCDCTDFIFRRVEGKPYSCKHLLAVWCDRYFATRRDRPACPACGQRDHAYGMCVDSLCEGSSTSIPTVLVV